MRTDASRHVFLRLTKSTEVAGMAKASAKGSTGNVAEIDIPKFRGVRSWSSKLGATTVHQEGGLFHWDGDAFDEVRITVRDQDSPPIIPATNNDAAGMDTKIGLHIVWRKGTDGMDDWEFSPRNQRILKHDIDAAKAACEMLQDLLRLPDCPTGSNPNDPRNRTLFNSFSKIGTSTYYIYQDISSSSSLNITAKTIAESLRKQGIAIPKTSFPLHLDLHLTRNMSMIMQAAWTMEGEGMDIRLEVQKGEHVEVLESSRLGKQGLVLKWDNTNGPSFAPFDQEKDNSPDSSYSQSRHSTVVQPARSFHPKLVTTIEVIEQDYRRHPFSACSLDVLYTLPASIFVDPYQLADLNSQSLAGNVDSKILGVWGETDLEKPVDQVRGWGSLVLVHVENGSTIASSKSPEGQNGAITITLPAHTRYQPPRSDGASEISIEMRTPDVFWVCQGSNERAVPDNLVPSPLSILFPSPPSNGHREFFPLTADTLEAAQRVYVPVGRIQDIGVVGAITPIAAVFACVVIGIGMWLQANEKSVFGRKKVQ